ncbi:MAG: chromate transporter [Lachnospiraceae bacterium]
MIYFYLFLEFFKTGLFAIGGGMATIPFLYEIASKYDWFTTANLVDMIAISESTPGPVGINMATFAGFMAGGIYGGLLATFSLVLPAYIIIICIAGVLDKFQSNRYVQNAFAGLRPAVVGLLLTASIAIFKVTFFKQEGNGLLEWIRAADIPAVIFFVVLLFSVMKFKKHPIIYIIIGAVFGVLFHQYF